MLGAAVTKGMGPAGTGAVIGAKTLATAYPEGATEMFQNIAQTRAQGGETAFSLDTFKEAGSVDRSQFEKH